jgi:hypothetical protein
MASTCAEIKFQALLDGVKPHWLISTQDPDGRDALLQRDARLAELPLHVTDALF